jgi:uncharacterized membrane protein
VRDSTAKETRVRHDPNTNRFVGGILSFIFGAALLVPSIQRGEWWWICITLAIAVHAVWMMVSSAIVYFRRRRASRPRRSGEEPGKP